MGSFARLTARSAPCVLRVMFCFQHRVGWVALTALALLVGMLLAGCGGGRYGGLRPFEGRKLDRRDGSMGANYLYYRAPNVERPNAVVAIDKRYTLQTSAWSAIPAAADGRDWRVYVASLGSPPKILEIRGPDGEHIGIWYSVWSSTVVKLLDDHTVMVYPPDPNSGPQRRDRD